MNDKRPYIILSAAMTIDGKIATKTGDPELSDEEDWKEIHKLRTEVDAIMVGKGTIISDNPKLHIKYFEHTGYYRIVIDSNLSIPIDYNVITFEPEIYPTIICATENADLDKIRRLKVMNIKVIQTGKTNRVDIKSLMPKLYSLGIKSILLEGGGKLNWSFLKEDLINEIRLTVAPWMVGGKDAPSLVDGEGLDTMAEGIRYKLSEVRSRNDYIMLRYKRDKS